MAILLTLCEWNRIIQGYFIRHRNRRLQVTQIRTQGDKNDASFMMTDAYTGGATSVITETEQVC